MKHLKLKLMYHGFRLQDNQRCGAVWGSSLYTRCTLLSILFRSRPNTLNSVLWLYLALLRHGARVRASELQTYTEKGRNASILITEVGFP